METLEYLSVFSIRYWKTAWKQLSNLRQLMFASVICALYIAIESFFIPVGSNLRVYFTFLVASLGAAVYGPVMAVLVGFVSDLLGYIIHPSGAFFPGYTLSAMLGGFIYGIMLFRHPISILRLLLARGIINYGVNVLLGSLWSAMLYSKGYYYYFASSILKNTILLPFEVIAMAALFRLLLPQLIRLHAVPPLQEGKRTVPLI